MQLLPAPLEGMSATWCMRIEQRPARMSEVAQPNESSFQGQKLPSIWHLHDALASLISCCGPEGPPPSTCCGSEEPTP
eukprot:227011-Amphidinium_carterae.1